MRRRLRLDMSLPEAYCTSQAASSAKPILTGAHQIVGLLPHIPLPLLKDSDPLSTTSKRVNRNKPQMTSEP